MESFTGQRKMKNIRSRPPGYFLTILQENDGYFWGREKGLSSSSRRHSHLGSTIKSIREEMKNVQLLEGERVIDVSLFISWKML